MALYEYRFNKDIGKKEKKKYSQIVMDDRNKPGSNKDKINTLNTCQRR